MRKCRVVNVNGGDPYDVYIGRPARGLDGYFGNPYKFSSRNLMIEEYTKYFRKRIEEDPEFKQRVLALRGLTLGCYCAPKACHGYVIAAYVNWYYGDEA